MENECITGNWDWTKHDEDMDFMNTMLNGTPEEIAKLQLELGLVKPTEHLKKGELVLVGCTLFGGV
ncbi:hypothetical protein [Methanobacterium paludis]|uniref:Uncharacterized protein n=1 Tax=Methanobacterium paludis (strain DSM 25820 / JCM 18151 / SWAN1) TaxID=868131 RepID=F6D2T6_METPW|nr:hypothetical protein [Methanobacterium paludis]AEG18665.1 hypothetical protein MSWAN_1654 [Methanobacterium paludis]